jgi:hypothetical protein
MAREPTQERSEDGESWPPPWKPEPGEALVGRLVRTGTRTTRYGPSAVAVIEDEAGVSWCVYLSTVLKGAFDQQQPRPEERVRIQYQGKHEAKGYHLHTLVCERGAPLSPPPRPPERAARAQRPAVPPAVNRGPAEADANDPFLD